MTDHLVTIRTYWNTVEACRDKSLLDEASIKSILENEYAVMMTPHLADPSGIKLKVKSSDVQISLEILAPNVD